MTIDYADEKLSKAVATLATGLGTLQERLVDAWIDSLVHISPDRDLPKDLRHEWEMIDGLATAKWGEAGEGSVRATILTMTNEEAQDLAHQVLRFQHLVESCVLES